VSFEGFTEGSWWGGRPVARKIGEVVPRGRLVVTGTIVEAKMVLVVDIASYCCVVGDGTGQVDLIFLGRRVVPGLGVGSGCTVEGTVTYEGDRLVVWNPLYRLDSFDLRRG
jgi:hypothetical protein